MKDAESQNANIRFILRRTFDYTSPRLTHQGAYDLINELTWNRERRPHEEIFVQAQGLDAEYPNRWCTIGQMPAHDWWFEARNFYDRVLAGFPISL